MQHLQEENHDGPDDRNPIRNWPTSTGISGSSSSASSLSGGEGSSKPNPLISVTEKCRICGEAAAKHVHYGAVTCFSCRAFFRRSIQNGCPKKYSCRKGGNCNINLKTRKNCQKCRFEKCLEAGMKTSWVLTDDERFRRFRKHREKVVKRQFEHEEFRDLPDQNPEDHLEINYREDSPTLQIAEPEDDTYETEHEQDQPIDFSGNSGGRSQPLSQMPPLQPLVLQHPQYENGSYKQGSPELQVNSPELQQNLDDLDNQTGQIQVSKGLFARLIDVTRDEVKFSKL